MSTFRDQAIPLVIAGETGFEVNPEAITMLQQVPQPISVVGVAGLYRTGKSYLLNRIILNRTQGFGVGSTISACTKGIWIWGRPLKAQNVAGEVVNLIVLDSEGLGALDQDSSHDCRIFALVLLLSSVFLYNSTGVIDENAISQLSLVINLTKHIKVRAERMTSNDMENALADQDDDDSEEFASHFPAFLWVLRDFALQMVDEFGGQLSSDAYLEGALQIQKGISDDAEQKNRVRRLIQAFFKERHCHVLVRPLTDESALCRLEEVEFEQLRPEFVCQALELRKELFAAARKKTFRGRDVSGEVLGGLLISYVEALNNGAVPNIEGAWTYVCQAQAQRLSERVLDEFHDSVRENVESAIPMSEHALRRIIKRLSLNALERFQAEAALTGEARAKFEEAITSQTKEVRGQMMAENDREFDHLLSTALANSFGEQINDRLVVEGFVDAKELSSALSDFRKGFEALEPDGPRKLERLFRFIAVRGAESFVVLARQREAACQAELGEATRKHSAAVSRLEARVREVEEAKTTAIERARGMDARLQEALLESAKLTESLRLAQEQLELLEKESTERRAEERAQFKKRVEELTQRAEEAERKQRELESVISKLKVDFETQLAIINQQLEFAKASESSFAEEQMRASERLRQAQEETTDRIARLTSEYEARIKALTAELHRARDQRNEAELSLGNRAALQESICKDYETKEGELKLRLAANEQILAALKEELASREEIIKDLNSKDSAAIDTIEQLKSTVTNFEATMRKKEEQIKKLTYEVQKAEVINSQNKEFYEIQQADLLTEIADLKRMKDTTLQALQASSTPKGDFARQLTEVREALEERLKAVSAEREAEKEEAQARLTAVMESEEQLRAESRAERERLLVEAAAREDELELLKSKASQLEERLRQAEASRSQAMQDREAGLEVRLREAESEMEALRSQKDTEIETVRADMQDNLRQLQTVFENEKVRIERRLAEERARLDAVSRETLTELEARHSQEVLGLESEIESLENELSNQDLKHRTSVQKLESELAVIRARLEASDRRVTEARQSAEKELEAERSRVTALQASLEADRAAVAEKQEQIQREMSNRMLELHHQRQTLENQLAASQRALSEREKQIGEALGEAGELRTRCNTIEAERTAISEELVSVRVQLSKEAALAHQRSEFFERRLTEVTKALEVAKEEAEERLKQQRAELEEEISSMKKNLNEEILLWDHRYEEKKKGAKEIEVSLTNKIAELERSKFSLQEKLTAAEARKDELEKKLLTELNRVEIESRRTKEAYFNERKGVFAELESLRREKYQVELNMAESQALADKERTLLEGKIMFLDQQVKKYRNDHTESQIHLQELLSKTQKFRDVDKEENESTLQARLTAAEQRHATQIADLREQLRGQMEVLKEKLRGAEREVKRLEALNQELAAGRPATSTFQEKKITELLENEKRLQDEILRFKNEANRELTALARDNEREKELTRKKVYDAEAKVKRLETERNLQFLETEKLKTKLQIEKDNLLRQNTESLEAVERLQKQKDSMAREIERLKGDLKVMRRSNVGNTLFSLAKTTNKSDLFSIDKSMLSSREYIGSNQQADTISPNSRNS